MPRFNLLSTTKGRLAAFTLLYVGEGLPQGFATAAVALELKRLGASAAVMGTFAASIMAPWAWKWAFGPVVDNVYSRRFGRRSQWVVACQIGMIATLLLAMAVFPTEVTPSGEVVGLALFGGVLLCHNAFGAAQDVAIDALAVSTLTEEERGRANGLMFGGAQIGMAIGGSGVIFLKGVIGFGAAALIVPLCLVGILAMVVTMVREAAGPAAEGGGGAKAVGAEILDYLRTVFRVFFTTRIGFLGLLLALVPAGAMSLSLTVSNVISPTLGMSDDEIASLNTVGSVVFAIACVAGGLLSDRFGRRRSLAVFAGGMALPTLWLAWRFHAAGWVVAPAAVDGVWPRAEALITDWWIGGTVYAVFMGLMYGVRSALYMDIAEPRIAATQFTASMALLNFVTMYSYWWEGKALSPVAEGGWGFSLSQTMVVDAAWGLVFLLLLPLLPHRRSVATEV